MIIVPHKDPFPFLLIKDIYDDYELDLIWREMLFLTHPSKFLSSSQAGGAVVQNEQYRHSHGLFLDDIYTDRKYSNILNINRKVFSKQIAEAFSDLSFGYNNYSIINKDTTFINYYESSDYYKPHRDYAIYSAITWFYAEPKHFYGGDFNFDDYGYNIPIQNNTCVIFPSFVRHSVDQVSMISPGQEFSCLGRYSMSQFMSHV